MANTKIGARLESVASDGIVAGADAIYDDELSKSQAEINQTIAGKYSLPSGGIPATDLASAVQTSLDRADTALQSHQDISGLAEKANYTAVTTLSSAPTESTLTYMAGGQSRNFKIGDEARVQDEDAETGYTYYKLYDLVTEGNTTTAVWDKLGSGGGASALGTITVVLKSVINSTLAQNSDLNGKTVTLTNITDNRTVETKTWQGSKITFSNVTPLKDYSISVQSHADYTSPSAQTITALGIGETVDLEFSYTANEYSITISDNQNGADTADAKVTYNSTEYASGDSIKVPSSVTITVSDLAASSVGGYSSLISLVGTAFSVVYSTEIVTVNVSALDANEQTVMPENATVTINGTTFTLAEDETGVTVDSENNKYVVETKVPSGTAYSISATGLEGYDDPEGEAGITAASTQNASRTVNLVFNETVIVNGVFAYYSDGSLKGISEADSSAIGVAVITDDCSFVIGKNDGGTKAFGGYDKDMSALGIVVADQQATGKADFAGNSNTTKIINACAGYTNNSVTGAPAAEWCRTQFNGKGYLPSLGEMYVAYSYKTEVEAVMTAISGTAFQSNYYWCSTLYNASLGSWLLHWNYGYMYYNTRNLSTYVRAFCALTPSVTLTLSSTDGTSVGSRTFTVTDSTGNVQSLTTDSNGQATANLATGNVEIRIPGCQTLTKTIAIDMKTKTATVSFCTPTTGVYAYYSDGTMLSESQADTNAIGVAVITSNCSFVIGKTHNTLVKFGGYSKDLSAIGVVCTSTQADAQVDYLGESNTDRIIEACAGYTDSTYSITGAPAAEWARSQFDGKGYLGSLGEWYTAYSNKATIDSMMTKIGGTAISTSDYHWTSTLYNASHGSWVLFWRNGSMTNRGRDGSHYVRAFCAL